MFITAVSLFAVFIPIEIDASDKVKDTVRSAFVDKENEDFLSPEFYQRGNCLGYYISTGNGNIYKTYYDDRYDVYGCGEDEVFKTKNKYVSIWFSKSGDDEEDVNEARYGKGTDVEIRLDQFKWCLPTNEDI